MHQSVWCSVARDVHADVGYALLNHFVLSYAIALSLVLLTGCIGSCPSHEAERGAYLD